MRISKRTREQAWLICAIAASQPKNGLGLSDVATELDTPVTWVRCGRLGAFLIAHEARVAVEDRVAGIRYEESCAEAEALLRCGWSPGDEP